jgi:hypothetical protein
MGLFFHDVCFVLNTGLLGTSAEYRIAETRQISSPVIATNSVGIATITDFSS